jgi:hypothetical protein
MCAVQRIAEACCSAQWMCTQGNDAGMGQRCTRVRCCAPCMKPMLKLEKRGPLAASASGAVAGAFSRSHAPCGCSLLLMSCGAGRTADPCLVPRPPT